MALQVLTIGEQDAWDTIVRSFSNYDVYYLSGYVKAFQLHGDGEPLLFSYEGNGLRGINVVMKRDIAHDPHFAEKLPEGRYFDFATPYGYGGWLLEGDGDPAALFEAYQNWCCAHGIVSEFVRFHPILQNYTSTEQSYEIVPLGKTVAMDLRSPETIWKNLTSQNRGRIRKAKKNGVHVYHGHCPELYEVFRELYNATMTKDHAVKYYYFSPVFYESLLNDLPYNAQVFYAQVNGITIAAYIMLTCNGWMHYHLGGSRQDYLDLAPNNLLMFEAALWGSANGYKTLHLGGGVGCREDSLYQFKKGFFRGEMCEFSIGRKVFLPDIYEELSAMREGPLSEGFFPRYRA